MKPPIDMNEAEIRNRFDFSKATRGRFHKLYRNGHTVTFLDHDPDNEQASQINGASETTRQAGMRIFESQVRAAGLRLDEPSSQNGIDYFIYREPLTDGHKVTYPVKIKTSAHEVFALYKKDSKIPRLLVAYVWHAKEPKKSKVYALTYKEALQIIQSKPYVTSKSWTEDDGYSVTHSGEALKEMLEPYQMTRDRWHQRLQTI